MQISSITKQGVRERRYDLDWLRVIAFGLLIYFHAAIVFIPNGLPLISNAQSSIGMQIFVAFLQEFRLGLLFLVAGMGVKFALARRSRTEFFLERSRRLLIPLVFGIFVLVPPMVYLEKWHIGQFSGSLFEFYAGLLGDGVYPSGSLSWHHFWFVAYLFIYCVICWPLFRVVMSGELETRLQWLSQKGRLFYILIPLLVFEIPLRFLFPGFRDLIHDWASFMHWGVLFMTGFAAICYRPMLDSFERLWVWGLLAGVACTGLLFLNFFDVKSAHFSPLHDGQVSIVEYLWFCVLRMANSWAWLIACVGFAGRYFNRPSKVLVYLNSAVYPLFCLHLTITVAIAYFVVETHWSIAGKYLFITSSTFALSLLLFEGIRRVFFLRPLFGLPPLSKVLRQLPTRKFYEELEK
ncbi:MAG: acyltransferase family protein [Pseudomonadota bacterium]